MTDFTHLLSPRSADVQHNAGFFRRALAFIVDILLIDIFITAPFTAIFADLATRTEFSLTMVLTRTEIAAMISVFLIVYAYFVIFEYVLGQTPGMMLLGTRAENTDNIWRSLLRNVFILPFFPIVLFWLIEPVAIIMRRRGLLEILSNTRTTYRQQVMF